MIELPKRVAGPDAPQRVQFGNFDIMSDAEGRPLALGKGTFGRTYKACHRFLDTIVALKIINERYATNNDVRQRFLVEARAVARLSHPHIAKLYDFGEVDGVLHYAMEYCGGGSLADRATAEGKIPLRQVVEVGQQISGALKCAHAAGFIHRDLKPSNIMLTQLTGPFYTKLIDFGLVQPSLPTATGSISDENSADGARFLGTPLFASPEQLREEPLDVRTDLFALGITLWYLLLGRPPESGSSAEIAASRLSPETYASRLAADMPAPLLTVLSRLLEKDRKNRFASAQEVFDAFNICAAELGFRRARDYTDAASEWGEWEEEVAAPPAVEEPPRAVAEVDPIEVERVDAALGSEFKIVARANDDFSGVNYMVQTHSNPAESVIAHVLHEELVADEAAMERLRVHVAQLMALDMPEILRPQALRAYSDYHAVIVDAPKGKDLLSVLRTESVVPLIEVAPLLETIADACDRLTNSGLPGAQLAPSRIFLNWPDASEAASNSRELNNARPVLYPRFLALSEAPELARMSEPEDVSTTMTTDMLGDPSRADNMCEHFGTLLYRMVAGRNCPITASLSSQAYVAVPGLSEQSNRLLSLVIAKQIERDSCGQVLREILSGEGIVPRVAGHASAGFTARTGSTVAPGATPPLVSRTPPRTASSSTVGSTRTRPLPSVPSATPPPPPIPPVLPPVQKMPTQEAKVAEKSSPPKISPPAPPPMPPAVEVAKPVTFTPPASIEVPKPVEVVGPKIAPQPISATATPEPVIAKGDDVRSREAEPVVTAKMPQAPSAPPEPSAAAQESSSRITEARAPQAAPPAQRIEEMRVPEPAAPTPTPAAPLDATPAAPPIPPAQKKKEQKVAKTKPPLESPPVEEVEAVTEKIVRPLPVVLPPPVSAPPSLAPKPAAQPTVVRAPAAAPQDVVQPWLARNIKMVGIGIAAALALSVGAFAIQKLRSKSTTASAPAKAPAAVSKPAVEAVAPPSAPAVPAPPVVAAKVEPAKPAAATRTVAGRYVGEVRPKAGSSANVPTAEREVSIDSALTSGYVVDYAGDGTTKVPVTGSSGDGGVYTGRVLFSSATGGQRSDETITIRPAQDNTTGVTFEGREPSGQQYALEGVLHPWSDEDTTRLDKLLAERSAQPSQNVTGPDEAKAAAERQAAANAARAPNIPKQPQQKQPANQDAGRRSQGTRSQTATQPAPRAPTTRQAPAPAAPRPANPQQRRRSEFGPTAPGG